MKKFYLILCALTLAMTMSAQVRVLTPKQAKKQQLSTQVLKHDKRALIDLGKFAKSPMESSFLAQQEKAAKARKAEVQDVTITSVYSVYYPETGTIWYSLSTEAFAPSFSFSIYVPEGKRDVELGKTYTFADMEHDEEYNPNYWDDEDWASHEFVEATFTKTVGSGYDMHIAATVTDVDGNKFNIHYDEEPIDIKDEKINVTLVSDRPDTQYLDDGSWMLRAGGKDHGYSVQVSYYSDNKTSPVGTFKGEDIDYTTTVVNVFTDEVDEDGDKVLELLEAKYGDITVTEDNAAIYIKGELLCNDGYTYVVDVTMKKPQPDNYANITSTSLSVDDYWFNMTKEINFFASDGTQSVRISIFPEETNEGMAGTYNIGQNGTRAAVRPSELEDEIEAYHGTFTVTYNEGDITLTGSLLCFNNTAYTLELSYTKPVKSREQSLEFNNLTLFYNDESFEAFGFNDDSTQAIDLAIDYKVSMTGDYTVDDIVTEYSFVSTDIDTEAGTAKRFRILEANLHCDYNEADMTAEITGTMLCQNLDDATDIPEFTVSMRATVPAPFEKDENEDFTHNFDTYIVDTESAEFGIIFVNANDGEAAIGLEFCVAEGETTLPTGTYDIDGSNEINTVTASKGMNASGRLTLSLAGLINDSKQFTNAWYMVSGNVTVAEDGVITVNAYNTKGKNISCTLLKDVSGVTDVKADVVKTTKYLENGQILISRNGKVYSLQGIQVK